ncbi:MAG: hypothetical protein A4E58_00601 [Syntrophorhabdus sp. PtaB.Bin006]|nr:MAG: hypothetical protein A4E58_00601 [Syntrophorhabdus sp. PtaB.Bin006]
MVSRASISAIACDTVSGDGSDDSATACGCGSVTSIKCPLCPTVQIMVLREGPAIGKGIRACTIGSQGAVFPQNEFFPTRATCCAVPHACPGANKILGGGIIDTGVDKSYAYSCVYRSDHLSSEIIEAIPYEFSLLIWKGGEDCLIYSTCNPYPHNDFCQALGYGCPAGRNANRGFVSSDTVACIVESHAGAGDRDVLMEDTASTFYVGACFGTIVFANLRIGDCLVRRVWLYCVRWRPVRPVVVPWREMADLRPPERCIGRIGRWIGKAGGRILVLPVRGGIDNAVSVCIEEADYDTVIRRYPHCPLPVVVTNRHDFAYVKTEEIFDIGGNRFLESDIFRTIYSKFRTIRVGNVRRKHGRHGLGCRVLGGPDGNAGGLRLRTVRVLDKSPVVPGENHGQRPGSPVVGIGRALVREDCCRVAVKGEGDGG